MPLKYYKCALLMFGAYVCNLMYVAPLATKVDTNANVALTACLAVYVGCYRSLNSAHPHISEGVSMSNNAMRQYVKNALLFSLCVLLRQVLPKDLADAALAWYFYVLGIFALPGIFLPAISRFLSSRLWEDEVYVFLGRVPYFHYVEVECRLSYVVAAIPGAFLCGWYAFQKHWFPNNVLGLAFCIQVTTD
ncbi:signal peptide peptidase-like [Papaver somniferum]|uniref:signal peptide peptidase-like n=1 Tax=Papaver somniferum TaxID=3469 RepID=UPI000E6FB469|nr:signal peptide peptidase-like [Papaver somniferum]